MTRSRAVSLSVNVDHVATVREARQVEYPDPVAAARIAEEAGASGITVHLRSDRRHIQDHDLFRLESQVRGKLNLEMAATDEMLEIALQLAPHQVTLVPERPEEVTTEGGLDLTKCSAEISMAAQRLTAAGIEVSVFLDPDSDQLDALAELGNQVISGFEINTDLYTRGNAEEAARQLEKARSVASRGARLGFSVFAGHGLTTSNVTSIAAIPEVEELNIGHWLISRAVLVGLESAVREMLTAMQSGAPQSRP